MNRRAREFEEAQAVARDKETQVVMYLAFRLAGGDHEASHLHVYGRREPALRP